MLYLTLKAGTGTEPGTTLLSLNLTPAPDAKGIYRMSEGSINTAYKCPQASHWGRVSSLLSATPSASSTAYVAVACLYSSFQNLTKL